VPAAEWQAALRSKHFDFSEWLRDYLAAGHRIVANDAVEGELRRAFESISSSVSGFSDRAQSYVELCELAILEKLDSLAETLLRRSLRCILGYGWHKDLTMSLVLDAVGAIAQVNHGPAKSAIARICPIVARIDDITDGDETAHTKFELAALLLRLMPESYTPYYQHLLETSEWYEADNVFVKLLETTRLDSPLFQFVAGAVWDSSAIGTLRKRAADGDASAAALMRRNEELFGWGIDELAVRRSHETPSKEEPHGLVVRRFRTDQLSELLGELDRRGIHMARRAVVREWFDYWRSRKGVNLLRALEPFRDAENMPWEIAELLDGAFELSLALEGKQAAYPWLVSAQVHGGGWEPFYSEKDSIARFRVFAESYPKLWGKFIHDTSKPRYSGSSERLVIPSNRLVQFLVAVGQVDIAIQVAEAMVSEVVDDASEQPLAMPAWFSGT